jgi:hypothetical protein
MGDNKIDITSSIAEKGIDSVKGFLEKLVGSTLEETGLLLGDKVRIYRLKNQIKMLSKTKQICEENNISIKQVSMKTMLPLLEYASLEDDENIQQKWANLLTNYVDSKKNLESSIFPYLLNQLSGEELEMIERLYNMRGIGGMLLQRMYVEGVMRSNLIRLGIAEAIIEEPKKEAKFVRHLRGFTDNNKTKITPLGVLFYESCRNI